MNREKKEKVAAVVLPTSGRQEKKTASSGPVRVPILAVGGLLFSGLSCNNGARIMVG